MMTQYKDEVELQKKNTFEEYSDSIRGIQVHRISSMYDNRPQDTEKHSVTDIEYMSENRKNTS